MIKNYWNNNSSGKLEENRSQKLNKATERHAVLDDGGEAGLADTAVASSGSTKEKLGGSSPVCDPMWANRDILLNWDTPDWRPYDINDVNLDHQCSVWRPYNINDENLDN